ncbi:hypothetical protein A2331_04550 [Candidatus Falkowbacteria bacterium RIFOXYB2_FULL_34_18]|uniref:Uncharacterized protein n=1 Tax=Candidatus Falkowbacteria bacterium RIFOXYD2_FULL_34_120 TaxID=1798007 RepID=A0A1F5TMJ8_9BACT|nr:MAG: hypothetical protein A2331_04550 [Candidatus Falkowbacteria bacterium RIFOXYB2_FULL_34_18]OGF30304.1 MAG: hypothetical protein A2500_06930 [Candidatus Falkowbacteria bacterium RIFOXYC12_FULL_34_55]OGF37854.1 MAG: hypothetical protein A2466_04055 [Candidatus Falkowbacteria bacterium RIFOXYC2_FULL_34_220]OGF39615.1 MAG: hypothetical protein A2515_03770 [Candidatus Falkowbacteria bacterium RIFOXYD12_FULL_34_57]OGF40039.1 MAG: hypothetical protein A2531_07500 [Candidatus Falkowbacteria bact
MELIEKVIEFFKNAEKIFDDERIKEEKRKFIVFINGLFFLLTIIFVVAAVFFVDPYPLLSLIYILFVFIILIGNNIWMSIKLLLCFPYTGPITTYIFLKMSWNTIKKWPKKIWYGDKNNEQEKQEK